MSTPETKYTKSGDVHIAYQVVGNGPLDLVLIPGFLTHLEYQWEEPRYARWLERLASFSRLIRFDKRGTGLSDRTSAIPTLEQRMDDVRAVMDAVGSQRAVLFGVSEGGPMSLLFAATYPQRTAALILYGSFARRAWAPDHPFGRTHEDLQRELDHFEHAWGQAGTVTALRAPSADAAYQRWAQTYWRLSGSPGAAIAIMRINMEIDVRHILPAIRVPTLVLHRTDERVVHVEQSRYLGAHIRGAELVELPGIDHTPFVGNGDAIVEKVQEFATRAHDAAEHDRVVATILFMDIARSTERAAAVGDREWRQLLEQYYSTVRRELLRFRGHEIDTAGDGLFASFDGPARAIRCAASVRDAVRTTGIELRAGLHAGECERVGEKLAGIAVHIGARVAARAASGEILVSHTVRDLVAGSGLVFESRGAHTLKGVPGKWPLFVVTTDKKQANA